MTHYICTGECKGVSDDSEAVCQSPKCSRHGMKLEECDCEDGKHGRIQAEGAEETPTEEATM